MKSSVLEVVGRGGAVRKVVSGISGTQQAGVGGRDGTRALKAEFSRDPLHLSSSSSLFYSMKSHSLRSPLCLGSFFIFLRALRARVPRAAPSQKTREEWCRLGKQEGTNTVSVGVVLEAL